MSGTRAAIRYANAVLQNAGETASVKALFDDMQTVKSTLQESKELRTVLKSPIIKAEDKKAILMEVFQGQSEGTKSLIGLLSQNQRANILGQVADSFIHLYNEAQGVKVAKVITAVPLSGDLEKQVLAKVESLTGSKKVTLENEVDQTIIGGFILRVGDMQYNASIANQLGNLKREFSKSL
ncbi:MAG TPA: ATP synthase F1 subunit delta [Flavobacteriaceae bacterium]|nr:ATP synthase F1 subunit delta [Flavobacteriaceae bacterium]MCB9211896.1 ATP synthase F1 subunit delta [Alteromonas sp.]HPF10010.1 ATP synthase F1 subunit delta [Flavobacteriaceae bacterium]HQU22350.1 ATP synthase F1 subunit delta [Flavobacteriaceae bacterium]HQU63907.1 ATP synthase F1 subunit delta [Flavobacteriaceae bacterium]